jgi:hypothetical protein
MPSERAKVQEQALLWAKLGVVNLQRFFFPGFSFVLGKWLFGQGQSLGFWVFFHTKSWKRLPRGNGGIIFFVLFWG